MDYEKEYKKLKEVISKAYIHAQTDSTKSALETILPELKESEDDKMWKFIKKYVHCNISDMVLEADHITREQLESWLEKQSEHVDFISKIQVGDKVTRNEAGILVNMSQLNRVAKPAKRQSGQKPTDSVETKFRNDDWVVNEEINTVRIISADDDRYEVEFMDGTEGFPHIDYIDRNFHLWTIRDAKDGDVLQLGAITAIFKEFIGNEKCGCYCSLYNREFEIRVDNTYGCYNAVPATKEQRDALMKAMAYAGYEFDFEKKELKRIGQKPANKVEPMFHEGDWVILSLVGEKDKLVQVETVEYLPSGQPRYVTTDGKWFGNGANSRLWTIKDAKDGDVLVIAENGRPFIFKGCSDVDHPNAPVAYCGIAYEDKFIISTERRWWTGAKVLPSTKDQRDLLFREIKEAGYEWDDEKKELKKMEQNPAWGEEDDKKFYDILAILRGGENCHYNTPDLRDWLKSLKQMKQWKPSDEQMIALDNACNKKTLYLGYLTSLYQDLKKLKGE